MNTWPLKESNLALVINNQALNASESVQFKIFDQKFPLEFTMLNVKTITGNNQTIVFIVAITYPDGNVIWQSTIESNQIKHNKMNRLNIEVSIVGKYECIVDRKRYIGKL